MGLNIKHAEIEAAIRELACKRDVSLTEAIGQAVREALDEEQRCSVRRLQELKRDVHAIQQQVKAIPQSDQRPWREVNDALFNDQGLPC